MDGNVCVCGGGGRLEALLSRWSDYSGTKINPTPLSMNLLD
jgi:hypothetical protein